MDRSLSKPHLLKEHPPLDEPVNAADHQSFENADEKVLESPFPKENRLSLIYQKQQQSSQKEAKLSLGILQTSLARL